MYNDVSKDIDELEDEIEYLKKRVSILEKKDNRRTSFKYLKIIIKILFFVLFIFGIWKGYDYVVNGLPNMINDKIREINPFKR